jgi:DNA-binding Lrp family transcriptional regulator
MKLSQFLASVNIFIDPSQKNNVLSELSKLQNAKEVYEVAGEYDIVSFISASSLEEFRDVLQKRVMKIKGVKSTITTVILSRYKESIVEETKKDEGRPRNLMGKEKHA